jgi:hypothetical protein
MSTCTWDGCANEATQPQLDANGAEWANLCQEHHDTLEDKLKTLSAPQLIKAWIKAQGGVKRMMGDE